MNTRRAFARRIRALCKRRGCTQEALSRDIGVAYPTLNKWACGHTVPVSRPTLDIIAKLEQVPREKQRR